MTRKLRSNFERGTSLWAVRRAQWKALGISDADMEKPKIAIVNSSSELSICFSHLDGVADALKTAIRDAGGLPFEIRTAAPSDFITSAGGRGRYILPSRDLITHDIEVAVEGAQLDGMVCLASCDKTTPGQIMAAARLNIPSIVAICGYQPSGELAGEHVDIEEVFLYAGHVAAGTATIEHLTAMADVAIRGPGVCSGMGTANSMHIVSDALGMSLTGSAPVLANSPAMMDCIRRTGERIVGMVEEDLKPRDILTAGAFANAAKAILAVCGSINTVKHLQAIAVEAECDVDLYALFEKFSAEVPVLTAVRPNGNMSIEEFDHAGGAAGILKRLEPMLDTTVRTVTGKTLGEDLQDVGITDDTIIRPLDRPMSTRPGLVIVRGTLIPDGGIVKLGLDPNKKLQFKGVAKVFEDTDEAIGAVKKGEIKAGEVVVLRGLGVKGAPGMGMASRIVFTLDGAGLGEQVAVVTDGQLSGLVNKGLVVGEATPEAGIGGPIGLVEDGDLITIDIAERRVDLNVPEDELDRRRERLRNRRTEPTKGWLGVYRKTAAPLSEGAVMRDE